MTPEFYRPQWPGIGLGLSIHPIREGRPRVRLAGKQEGIDLSGRTLALP
jgi:hypothetical protein